MPLFLLKSYTFLLSYNVVLLSKNVMLLSYNVELLCCNAVLLSYDVALLSYNVVFGLASIFCVVYSLVFLFCFSRFLSSPSSPPSSVSSRFACTLSTCFPLCVSPIQNLSHPDVAYHRVQNQNQPGLECLKSDQLISKLKTIEIGI